MATKSKKKPTAKKKTAPVKKPAAKMKAVPAKKSVIKMKSNILTPLEDRIVVRISAMEERTAGGLIIPGTVSAQQDRGEVTAKGPGRRDKKGRLRPLDVEVGDTVLFPQYTGSKITIEGEEFLIMREDDVLGVVET